MLLGRKPIGTIAYMGGVMSIPEPFMWSMMQMIEYNNEFFLNPNECVFYYRATVSYHSFARNVISEHVKGDWVLMLDTDHQFDPDIAARMLHVVNMAKEQQNIDIQVLTGLYQYKSPPYSPTIYRWKKGKKSGIEPIGHWTGGRKNILVPVGSAGGGCLWIRREVFERIRNELKQSPFDIIAPFSEDHSFFKRLQKLKIQAYCAPMIESNHLIYKALSLDDYRRSDILLSKKHKV